MDRQIFLAVYGLLALLLMLKATEAKKLKGLLLASYCGIVLISFTTGTTASIWLVTIFSLLLASVSLFRSSYFPAFKSKRVTGLTYLMFAVYAYGIFVGFVRYSPYLAEIKSGVAKTLFGIPLPLLMAGYRTVILSSLVFAFSLPLRYRIDRRVFCQCLTLCWIFTVVLSLLVLLDYAGVADLRLRVVDIYRFESIHSGVLGYHRETLGMMLLLGFFLSLATSQATESAGHKTLVFATLPAILIALLFSWSRAAMLGTAVGIVFLCLTLGGRRGFIGVVVTVLAGVVTKVALSMFEDVSERITFGMSGEASIQDISSGRWRGWIALLRWMADNPLTVAVGCGFQNFNYFVKLGVGGTTLTSAHNNFLNVLSEEGLIGLAVHLLWIVSILLWLISWRRSVTDPKKKAIPSIMFAAMLGILATCFFQESLSPHPLMVPFTTHFYLVLGFWIAYYRNEMMEECYACGLLDTEYWPNQQNGSL